MTENLNMSKNQIIEQALKSMSRGNIDSMNSLYGAIKQDVYAYALSKVCNKFDADDITQETFLKIYQNAKLYTPMGKPMAWIIKLETNIINRYFALKGRYESLNEDIISSTSIDEIISDEEKIDKDIYLNQLFKDLNEEERSIISLHLVSDLKFKEIASILDKPLSTVLSKYNRAIKKITKNVKEDK